VAEWFKAAVLKTVEAGRLPGVRIPSSPPVLTHPPSFPKISAHFLCRIDGGEKACDAEFDACGKSNGMRPISI
jgi:hypothetical protein